MVAELLTYFLLLVSILFLFAHKRKLAFAFLIGAVLAGLVQQRLDLIALPFIAFLAACYPLAKKFPKAKPILLVLFLLLSIALQNHFVPGFRNLRIFDQIRFSADSVPYSLYLNFDKVAVGFFIFLQLPTPRLTRERVVITLRHLALLLALMSILAPLTGYVRFDPKFPELTWLWMLNNFFFVCLAEEALFRGFIQNQLLRWMKPYAAIAAAAALFGLAHYQGGIAYILFAFLAGLFYGHSFWKTGRLQTAMAVHFGLNLVHFLFFSYPALRT